MQKNLKYFAFLAFLFSCKVKDKASTPVSYKIYCWSFFSCNDTVPAFTMTNTQINVGVLEIMQNKYLLIDDSDLVKSSSLHSILIEKKEVKRSAKKESVVDARFIIQLNYKDRRSDTLIYYNDSSFI